jgi:hypothetical protein
MSSYPGPWVTAGVEFLSSAIMAGSEMKARFYVKLSIEIKIWLQMKDELRFQKEAMHRHISFNSKPFIGNEWGFDLTCFQPLVRRFAEDQPNKKFLGVESPNRIKILFDPDSFAGQKRPRSAMKLHIQQARIT